MTLGGCRDPNGTKELQMWERETGTLHARTKSFPFMDMALDWIPSGARIASACSHNVAEKSARILFFERNGLERGCFDIDGPVDATVQRIKWNCSSDLLSVLLRCSEWDAVQIWSFSNYHWYLKQEWRYAKNHHVDFLWDSEKPMCLVTWTVLGLVQVMSMCWDSAATKESVGLVIDGSYLLVTPLTLALIPPPMSLFKLKFQAPVQAVGLHYPQEEHCFIAASLSNGAISLLSLPNIANWDTLEGTDIVVQDAAVSEQNNFRPCLRLLSWLDSGHLLGVMNSEPFEVPIHCDYSLACDSVDSFSESYASNQHRYLRSDILVELVAHQDIDDSFGIDGLCTSSWAVKYNKQTFSNQGVLAIMEDPLGAGLLVHFEDGSIHLYTVERGLSREGVTDSTQTLISPSLWVQALSAVFLKTAVIVALDDIGRLQVESHVLCTDCTSFSVHTTRINEKKVIHIVYTTKQDVLHIVNLEEVLGIGEHTAIVQDISHLCPSRDQWPGLESINTSKMEKKRNMLKSSTLWERGAKLVAALGGRGVAVVLQTARGNLETIFPRNFVLGSLAAALCKCDFKDAVLLARQHHISLNLIVDFRGWEAFTQLATDFVRQVTNLNHVTELICAVNKGNAMDEIYKDVLIPYKNEISSIGPEPCTIGFKAPSQSLPQGNKVQCVLHAIRKALQEEVAESPKRELCILTTMARSDPPELEAALQRIKQLREEEMQHLTEEVDMGLLGHERKSLSAEEALKHLLWLSDTESLFNAALGLYDLHLAAMVASNSQGDPKEFLPFLQELGGLPTPLMRYSIDHKLQRFESALKNLAAAGDSHFNKCLELMKDHPELFPLGKHIFNKGPERMAVLEAWGDHLLTQKRFEDAAAAFFCCSQLQKTMGAYRAGGLWQGVLVVAGMLGLPQEDVTRLAHDLREELQALGRPGDAAKVALEYCKDVEDAVLLFVEAREWSEAVRVAYSHGKMEQVKDQIQSAALECANSYMLEFEEGIEKVGKYLARYLAVRQRRMLLEIKLKMDNSEDVEDDAASDISSHVSGMSAYSAGTRSSKGSVISSSVSAPKQSHRKPRGGRIRAGSPGEEAALLEHLKKMELTTGTLEDLRKLICFLVLIGHYSKAEKLQLLAARFQSHQYRAVLEADGSLASDDVNRPQWCIKVLDTAGTSQ